MARRDRTEVVARERPDRRAVVGAFALAALAMALTWVVAVPSGFFVCPAIDPPPTNCLPQYRAGTALVVSVGLVLIMMITVFAALKGLVWRFVSGSGLAVLFFAPAVAWALVALLPGFLVT